MLALSRRQDDLAHALQLQKWARDACDHVSNEQKERCLTINVAIVVDRYGHLDAFTRFYAARAAPDIEEREAAIAKTVTKRKLRRRRQIEVGTGRSAPARRGAARSPVVFRWD